MVNFATPFYLPPFPNIWKGRSPSPLSYYLLIILRPIYPVWTCTCTWHKGKGCCKNPPSQEGAKKFWSIFLSSQSFLPFLQTYIIRRRLCVFSQERARYTATCWLAFTPQEATLFAQRTRVPKSQTLSLSLSSSEGRHTEESLWKFELLQSWLTGSLSFLHKLPSSLSSPGHRDEQKVK